MINLIERAIGDLENQGVDAEVILMAPDAFEKFADLFCSAGLLHRPLGDRFKFKGRLVVKHQLLPPGQAYVVDLDNAEKILGYRPKF